MYDYKLSSTFERMISKFRSVAVADFVGTATQESRSTIVPVSGSCRLCRHSNSGESQYNRSGQWQLPTLSAQQLRRVAVQSFRSVAVADFVGTATQESRSTIVPVSGSCRLCRHSNSGESQYNRSASVLTCT